MNRDTVRIAQEALAKRREEREERVKFVKGMFGGLMMFRTDLFKDIHLGRGTFTFDGHKYEFSIREVE